jgi:thiamine-phosphate pyrophosphorylase
MDGAGEAGKEGVMILSADAETLWGAATGLARAAAGVSRDPGRPALLFFTDPVRTPQPWLTAAALPRGAAVVYRSFGAADARSVAERLRRITAERGVRLLIGLDADLAGAVGADGVHLPERALNRADDLRRRHRDWQVTGAVHSVATLTGARALSAAILSPVFAAGGTSAHRSALGVAAFAAAVRAAPVPVYALGGINAANADTLTGSGACGLAGVASIQAAFGRGIRI